MGQSQNSHNSAKFCLGWLPSSLLRLTYLTRPRQSIRVSFSRLQNLQMHGLVNTDDETVVLRVWCNPFAMATRPLSNCFVSFRVIKLFRVILHYRVPMYRPVKQEANVA